MLFFPAHCSMTSNTVSGDSTPIVIALLFIWLILVLALVFFYKRLNKNTNGQYEIHRLIFAEGGLRDQLRQRVGVMENRLGVRILPPPHEEEEHLEDNEGKDEEDVDNDKENESQPEEEEEQENHDIKDDSSDDYSSIDLRERANKRKHSKNGEKTEDKEDKEKQEKAAGEDGKHGKEVKNEEKVGLLVDLKPFSGSAIWSEQSKDEGNDLTAL